MGAEKKLLPIKEAFKLAQQARQNQAKLVVALSRTYGTVSAPAPERSGRCCLSPSRDPPGASPREPNLLQSPDLAAWREISGQPLAGCTTASGADRYFFVDGALGENCVRVPKATGRPWLGLGVGLGCSASAGVPPVLAETPTVSQPTLPAPQGEIKSNHQIENELLGPGSSYSCECCLFCLP